MDSKFNFKKEETPDVQLAQIISNQIFENNRHIEWLLDNQEDKEFDSDEAVKMAGERGMILTETLAYIAGKRD